MRPTAPVVVPGSEGSSDPPRCRGLGQHFDADIANGKTSLPVWPELLYDLCERARFVLLFLLAFLFLFFLLAFLAYTCQDVLKVHGCRNSYFTCCRGSYVQNRLHTASPAETETVRWLQEELPWWIKESTTKGEPDLMKSQSSKYLLRFGVLGMFLPPKCPHATKNERVSATEDYHRRRAQEWAFQESVQDFVDAMMDLRNHEVCFCGPSTPNYP